MVGRQRASSFPLNMEGNPNFYNNGSQSLTKNIVEKTGCPVMVKDTENSRWWPIFMLEKKLIAQ